MSVLQGYGDHVRNMCPTLRVQVSSVPVGPKGENNATDFPPRAGHNLYGPAAHPLAERHLYVLAAPDLHAWGENQDP